MAGNLSFLDTLVEDLIRSKHNNYSEECISTPTATQITTSMMPSSTLTTCPLSTTNSTSVSKPP